MARDTFDQPLTHRPTPIPRTTAAIRAVRPVRPSLTALRAGKTILRRALAKTLGDAEAAEEFLREVLEEVELAEVPEGREPFVAFVREELLPRLMPLVRLHELHDLVRRTIGDEESLHPPPLKPLGSAPGTRRTERPRVVIVEPDAMRRIATARRLLREGFDVEAVPRAEDVLSLEPFHALVMPLDAEGERVVEALAKRGIRAGLVAMETENGRDALRRTIDRWPTDRVAVVPRSAAPDSLGSRVRIVLE